MRKNLENKAVIEERGSQLVFVHILDSNYVTAFRALLTQMYETMGITSRHYHIIPLTRLIHVCSTENVPIAKQVVASIMSCFLHVDGRHDLFFFDTFSDAISAFLELSKRAIRTRFVTLPRSP